MDKPRSVSLRLKPPVSAIPLLILFAIVALLGACSSLSAYAKAKTIADKVLPVFQNALELADQMRPLPGGQDALNAAAALLTAWKDGNESGFNAGVPCVKQALRSVAHAATLQSDDALASRLESVANVLQELDNGANCASNRSASDSGAGPQVPPKGSPLDSGADAGAALEPGLGRAPVRANRQAYCVSGPAARYRSAADGELDRLFLVDRAHGYASPLSRPRSIIRAGADSGPTWSA